MHGKYTAKRAKRLIQPKKWQISQFSHEGTIMNQKSSIKKALHEIAGKQKREAHTA